MNSLASRIAIVPRVVLSVLLATIVAACATVNSGSMPEQQARALWDRYLAAINALDLDQLSAVISDEPGFAWREAGRPGYGSKAEFMQAMASVKSSVKSASTTVADVSIAATEAQRATVSSRYVSRFAFNDGRVMTMTGRFSAAMKPENGSWRIVSGETIADGPPTFSR